MRFSQLPALVAAYFETPPYAGSGPKGGTRAALLPMLPGDTLRMIDAIRRGALEVTDAPPGARLPRRVAARPAASAGSKPAAPKPSGPTPKVARREPSAGELAETALAIVRSIAPRADAHETKICPSCKKVNLRTAKKCIACEKPLKAQEEEDEEDEAAGESSAMARLRGARAFAAGIASLSGRADPVTPR